VASSNLPDRFLLSLVGSRISLLLLYFYFKVSVGPDKDKESVIIVIDTVSHHLYYSGSFCIFLGDVYML
jgi:hypothetical protein